MYVCIKDVTLDTTLPAVHSKLKLHIPETKRLTLGATVTVLDLSLPRRLVGFFFGGDFSHKVLLIFPFFANLAQLVIFYKPPPLLYLLLGMYFCSSLPSVLSKEMSIIIIISQETYSLLHSLVKSQFPVIQIYYHRIKLFSSIYIHRQIEVRKCLLSFGVESFVFQVAIQKFKD